MRNTPGKTTLMPIYEYRCSTCKTVSEVFVKSINSLVNPVCKQCDSCDMEKQVSVFSVGVTEESVHRKTGTGQNNAMDYYKDPRNIGRNAEDTFKRYGKEVPESLKDAIKSSRQGNLPKGLD